MDSLKYSDCALASNANVLLSLVVFLIREGADRLTKMPKFHVKISS